MESNRNRCKRGSVFSFFKEHSFIQKAIPVLNRTLGYSANLGGAGRLSSCRSGWKTAVLFGLFLLLNCATGRQIQPENVTVKTDTKADVPADDFRRRTIKDSVLLEAELNKKSQEYFDQLYRSADYDRLVEDDRLTLIKKAASRLSVAMGYGYYRESSIYLVKYKKDPAALNAFVLPTGQIFVFEALADLLKQKAREFSNGSADDESRIFEGLLAAVIGHEIGHYYGKHQLKSELRKIGNLTPEEQLERIKRTDLGKAQILAEDIENEQNYEIQADLFAVTSMAKAGYDTIYLENLLSILKEYIPDRNPYLSTHPSMNRRISYISKDPEKQKRLIERIVRLEYAFASVETGYNLREAAGVVQQELERTPGNPHLLSALGKIHHRIWEESCEISDLRFKSSIIYSPFQEGMIHPATRSKEKLSRKFWCNQIDYETALRYYRDALKNFAGPYTATSYAVLLSYHPNPDDYSAALSYARKAFEEISEEDGIGKLRSLNNLGIVFFMNEKYEEAVSLFALAASRSVQRLSAGQFDAAADNILRGLSGKNTGVLLEAFYNLGAVYKEMSDLDKYSGMSQKLRDMAAEIWQSYVMLETDSQWGKYALNFLGSSFNQRQLVYVKPKVLFEITTIGSDRKGNAETREVTVGEPVSSIKFLEEEAGRSNFARGMTRGMTRGFARGFARGFSMGLTVNVLDDKLIGIRLDKSNSHFIKIDGKDRKIHVGMEKRLLEEILGKPAVVIGSTLFYPNYYSIFQTDSKDRVSSISIQETYKKMRNL